MWVCNHRDEDICVRYSEQPTLEHTMAVCEATKVRPTFMLVEEPLWVEFYCLEGLTFATDRIIRQLDTNEVTVIKDA